MCSEQGSSPDPLNLEAVDRRIRINELEQELAEMGMQSFHVSDDCPSEVHEQFLRSIAHFESGPLSSRFAQLQEAGIELPAPDAMNDAELHAKLWEIILALAKWDVYLYRTDHLSDRQLYDHLWSDSLREETTIMPPGSGWVCHFDLLGGCSEEDIQTGLRYYDDEDERRRWAEQWPDDVIPPHEDPPFDRDRLLPSPPPPPSFESDEADESDDADEQDDIS